MRKNGVVALVCAMMIFTGTSAQAVTYKTYKNCAAVNKVYAHGIAKKGYSKTASGLTAAPFVNTKLYNLNKSKDRDGDGVACER